MTTKEKLVVNSALRVVPLENLTADPSYQRDVKSKHKRIVADFNEQALGIPLIGEREDGSLWIVDGLQRVSALRKLGKKVVRAEVFRSEGPEHEATIFKLVNLNRVKLTPAEEFRALLAGQDASAWALKEAVEECGYTIRLTQGGKNRPTDLVCINNLRAIARLSRGLDSIKFCLNVAQACWPDDPLGSHGLMVCGMCLFYRSHDGLVDLQRLVPRLARTTPHKIIYTASQTAIGGNKSSATAEVIERVYRRRKP